MAKKTKANVQYDTAGIGKPEVGDTMIWDGKEFVRSNDGGLYLCKWGSVNPLLPHTPFNGAVTWENVQPQLFGPGTSGTMASSFNTTTGLWTCPHKGSYYFDFTLMIEINPQNFPMGLYNAATGGGVIHIAVGSSQHVSPGLWGLVCGNSYTIIHPIPKLILTTSAHVATVEQNTTIWFKVLNQCGFNIDFTNTYMGGSVLMNIRRL